MGASSTKRSIRRSDFVLKPFLRSNDGTAAWQLANTVVPYLILWVLAVQAVKSSLWLTAPLLVLMVLFSGRCFSLMHDCGHGSLFRTQWMNRLAGSLLGVINGLPHYPWSQGHAYHHRHNGNWDLYKGPSALITTEQYLNLQPRAQAFYRFLRHPLMLFPGGFFYLVIKPRLALVLGLAGFARHAATLLAAEPSIPWSSLVSSYRSRHWYSAAEVKDLLINTICVVGSWILLSHWLGAALFWSLYAIVMACSAALFICIFFIQHNFEGSYAHRSEGWSSLTGALEGTSFLKLPPVLNWFTADIGYHNIHHLCDRIPNYHLSACHRRNAALLGSVPTLTIKDIPACFRYILWNRAGQQLQPIPDSISS